MKTDKEVSGAFELREKAEIALRDRREEGKDFSFLSPEAKDNLIHELQVYQIELEMQNEELRKTQLELEASRNRYSYLYDFAPVGYLTMSENGNIEEVNLTLASMLGTDRSSLIGTPFTRLILRDDQDVFYKHRRRILETETSQSCDLRLVKKNGDEFFVHIECISGKNEGYDSRLIRGAVTDITERKKMDRKLQNDHVKLEEQVEERTAELRRALSEIKAMKDQLEAERAYLQEEIKLEYNHENIIGQSDGLNYVLYKAEQIASSNTIVLVLGETGTGKELVARAIHSLSLRKERALLKVNCTTLPSNLIESELFGHEKGAFTNANSRHLGRFEVADGTTLFLDEIGELPLELQPKLLRVIQDGEFERLGSSHTTKVDVRIIAATNRNLEEEVRRGRFREDLWYRLNIFPITMPPLRDRLDDIPLLVDFYVKKISKRMGKSIEIIPKSVMNALQNYHWPGNVRELENVLERAVINSSGPKMRLVDEMKTRQKDLSTAQKTLETVERDHIVRILEQTQWKVSGKNGAADILGVNRSTLRARMRKLGILKP